MTIWTSDELTTIGTRCRAQAAAHADTAGHGRPPRHSGFGGHNASLATEQIERQFQTNFYGVLYVMRAALPVMRK
jgi:NAD(P)-dependent dehydrogenase (short-subunit alcohol dehydrogenase family)